MPSLHCQPASHQRGWTRGFVRGEFREPHLVPAGAEPATGGEVEGASGAGGSVEEGEVAMAIDPGAAHNQVVGRAVRRHQAEHFACAPQLDARAPCKCQMMMMINTLELFLISPV